MNKQHKDMRTSDHASIDQLLQIRDGEGSAASAHVMRCKDCQQELAFLDQLNEYMVSASDQEPSERIWRRIVSSASGYGDTSTNVQPLFPNFVAARSSSVTQTNFKGITNRAVYSLAASILFIGFIGLFMFSQNNHSVNVQNQALIANIERLMISSQSMEQVLAQVSLQSETLTASQRAQSDRLQWQLAYLDQMIQQHSASLNTNPQVTEVLWADRIRALKELNGLYYQQPVAVVDSEI